MGAGVGAGLVVLGAVGTLDVSVENAGRGLGVVALAGACAGVLGGRREGGVAVEVRAAVGVVADDPESWDSLEEVLKAGLGVTLL